MLNKMLQIDAEKFCKLYCMLLVLTNFSFKLIYFAMFFFPHNDFDLKIP